MVVPAKTRMSAGAGEGGRCKRSERPPPPPGPHPVCGGASSTMIGTPLGDTGAVSRTWSKEQLAELARSLGHTDLWMSETKSGRRYAIGCACGWGAPMEDGRPTVTRATQAEAVRTLRYHLWKAVSDHVKAAQGAGVGVSFPGSVAGRR